MVKFSKQDLATSNDPAILESEIFKGLDKKQQRLIKNRLSADASRKRKKEQFEEMTRTVQELQAENLKLKERVEELLLENCQLQAQNQTLIGNLLGTQFPVDSINNYQQCEPPMNNCLQEQVDGQLLQGTSSRPPSPVPSTLNGSTLSIPAESEEELANRMLSDFIDFGDAISVPVAETPDYLHLGLRSIFSMFLFSFATFLLPSSTFQQHPSLPSNIPSLADAFGGSSFSHVSSSVEPSSSSLSEIVKDDWHLAAGASISALPLEPAGFLNSLSVLSKINPPNAIMGIEGLFQVNSNPMDVKLAIVPSSLSSLFNGYSKEFVVDSSSCANQASLMIDPSIRIAPYAPFIGEDGNQKNQQQTLRLSLFADIPSGSSPQSGLGLRGDGGILKLDLQVFRATWLEES